jgi:hypothetical protein
MAEAMGGNVDNNMGQSLSVVGAIECTDIGRNWCL